MAKINETTEVVKEVQPDLGWILARLESLEAENKALKEKSENMFEKAKKKYDWPRKYNYKTWDGVPVLSYVSKRKDTTKDLLFKNQYGEYVSNHLLELTLANDKTVKVEVNEFNNSCWKSEKLFADVISDGSNVIWYKFKTDDFWEITVMPSIIN